MFLTRMGRNSKIVVTGDVTQTDLPRGTQSGLLDVRERLAGIEGIAFCTLGRDDIVRHPLVQKIVDAYEASDAASQPPDSSSASEGSDA
jgi:phosphate starvation-inducible PhoH-like protein